MLAAFTIAKDFNQLCGGAVIAPWEINQLSDDWLLARAMLRADLSQMQTATQRIEARKAAIRKRYQAH